MPGKLDVHIDGYISEISTPLCRQKYHVGQARRMLISAKYLHFDAHPNASTQVPQSVVIVV